MKTEISQWEKRVIIFKFIYSYLINDWDDKLYSEKMDEETILFDEYIKPILENILNSKKQYLTSMNENISKEWTMGRISYIDKAIILTACGEFFVHAIDKKIIIDQAIITAKNYGDENSFKFINSVLDKIL
ncbi:MAG: transcription antitermination protein NusB [Malacoplasma sp.]